MRLRSIRSVGLGLALAASFVASAVASAQAPEEILVDVELKNADLLAATQMLTQRTGLQFVIEPSSEPFGKISLKLMRRTADEAIKYICTAAGAYFRRDENGVFIISRNKPVDAAPVEGVKSNAKSVSIFRKLKLQKGDARGIYEQILNINPYDPARPFKELHYFRNAAIQNSSLPPPSAYIPKSSGETFVPVGVRPYQAPRTGGESGNEIRLPGEGAEQVGDDGGGGGGRGGGGGFGGGGFGGQGGGGFGGQGGGGGGGQVPAGGFIPQGLDQMSYDPTDNSILVQGTEEAINALQRIISEFDRAPKQVEIKVEFVTTQSAKASGLGYDVQYQRGSFLFNSSFAAVTDPFFLAYSTGNVALRLRTFLTESQGGNVQSPTIRTMNNQPATIQSQTTTTIFLTQIQTTPNGNITTTTPISLTINSGLSVTPRINNDGTITMFLNPQLTDFGQIRRQGGIEVPDQVSQAIAMVARVKNGETVAMGGFNRKTNTNSFDRYPVLSDIPIIGQFFRRRTVGRSNTELIIFVTPTILDEDDTIGSVNP